MKLELTDDRKRKITDAIKNHFTKELEIDLSDFQIEQLVEFLLKDIGPQIYNQAINDVESFIKEKLTDLEGDLIEND